MPPLFHRSKDRDRTAKFCPVARPPWLRESGDLHLIGLDARGVSSASRWGDLLLRSTGTWGRQRFCCPGEDCRSAWARKRSSQFTPLGGDGECVGMAGMGQALWCVQKRTQSPIPSARAEAVRQGDRIPLLSHIDCFAHLRTKLVWCLTGRGTECIANRSHSGYGDRKTSCL